MSDWPESYLTSGEAETLFSGRSGTEPWSALSASGKTFALKNASRKLDECLRWSGTKTDSAQILAWPRTGAFDSDGIAAASDEIPSAVKLAAAEQTLFMLSNEYRAAVRALNSGIRSVNAGGMSVSVSGEPVLVCREAVLALRGLGSLRSDASGKRFRSGTLIRG